VNLGSKSRLALAVVGATGLVASFAVLAFAAPSVSHTGAAASAYCLPSDLANRKQDLAAATAKTGAAAAAAAAANAAVVRQRRAVTALGKRQKIAKTAYWKQTSHWRNAKRSAARAVFLKKQEAALSLAKKKLSRAVSAAAAAGRKLAAARSARAAAQAAVDQCS
jgi:hypothetical protein